MKYNINGISSPFGGISWSKSTTPKMRIKYLFTFLESKRILTNPIKMETPSECISSVLEIKAMLVEITKDIDFNDDDITEIKTMIAACNDYLDCISKMRLPHIIYKDDEHWADLAFDNAMKSFRSSFITSINILSKKHKIKFSLEIPHQW